MSRFFFDTDDGKSFVEDEEGLELDGLAAARFQAQRALADMAHDVVPGDGDQKTITVCVRDEGGRIVLKGTLSLLMEQGP